MSLFRKMSRRISSSDGRENKKGGRVKLIENGPVELHDNPMPVQRQMTTADLFKPLKTTAVQSTAMDRTLYEIPQPSKVDAMSDLIKDHTNGELFPYVGVVGNEGETPDARRARLLALKPSYNKRDIPEIMILGCPLISREGDFSMDSLMAFAKMNMEYKPAKFAPVPNELHAPNFTITKPYVHIRQVTILYTPNVSSTSNYCSFWMNLVDNRLIDSDRGSQTNVIVSNQEGIMEMSCDYCVSAVDFKNFTLSYTLERDIVLPGYQWGTASFFFSITESDLPFQTSKVDAMAVYRMPITTLIERTTNADKSDITFTPADLVKLRALYMQGDVVDVDQPKTARLKSNQYSKSSIRRKDKGEKIDTGNKPGWEFMEGSRKPKVDAYEASVDPVDDDTVSIHEVDTEEIDKSRQDAISRYKKQQEIERVRFENSKERRKLEDEEAHESIGPHQMKSETHQPALHKDKEELEESDALNRFFSKQKKQVKLSVSEV